MWALFPPILKRLPLLRAPLVVVLPLLLSRDTKNNTIPSPSSNGEDECITVVIIIIFFARRRRGAHRRQKTPTKVAAKVLISSNTNRNRTRINTATILVRGTSTKLRAKRTESSSSSWPLLFGGSIKCWSIFSSIHLLEMSFTMTRLGCFIAITRFESLQGWGGRGGGVVVRFLRQKPTTVCPLGAERSPLTSFRCCLREALRAVTSRGAKRQVRII